MNDINIEIKPEIRKLEKLKHSGLYYYPSIIATITNKTDIELEIEHTFLLIKGLDKPLPIGNFFSHIKHKDIMIIGGVLELAKYLNDKSIVFKSDIISLQIQIETNMGTFLSSVLDMKEG